MFWFLSWICQKHYTIYSLLSLSNIPSDPIVIKSWLFGSISKYVIYGLAINTFGFPPYFSIFASISPKDLETDNFPGKRRKGPGIFTPSFVFNIDWYTFPPPFIILYFSVTVSGLWSWDKGKTFEPDW